MADDQRKRGTLRKLSLGIQRRMNARTVRRIERKGGKYLGMDLLILHTVGRRTGQPRRSPLTWFADGENAWLLVASGGGHRDPDWYLNLTAHPDQVSIQFHGEEPIPVRPERLAGDERAAAWTAIVADQPRYGKYQQKSDREYPVVRLTRR
ncbi:nitroreductase family deazaflavin-dependent oxidoreductase [Nocardia sp. NPDC004068]|uniref:nitroreductase family deazaflavin-dependent oxidoreductase n=1 Tax=Nocardia sp. NPDC004068 TaxID=3364303 RepID=UPI0036AD8F3E